MATTTTDTSLNHDEKNDNNRKRKAEEQDDDDNNNNTNNNGIKVDESTSSSSSSSSSSPSCPHLDTIQRSLLDFDLERACQVSLQAGPHIYSCLVCGGYFRGRGIHTPAYTHAVEESHFVFCHLTKHTFYCLPDDYEITNPHDRATLQDIHNALYPTFHPPEELALLDQKKSVNTSGTEQQAQPAVVGRDLFGRRYIPGFLGMSNLHKTDCINAVVQALAHVQPLRDYFLLHKSTKTTNNNNNNTTTNKAAELVTTAFGDLVRQLWSRHRFKSHVDPHVLVNAITAASNKKFKVGVQAEAGEFMAWLLHQLSMGTSETITRKKGNKLKKKTTSIVQEIFQGKVRVTTRQAKRRTRTKGKTGEDGEDYDDRAGSDAEFEGGDNPNYYQQDTDMMIKNTAAATTTDDSIETEEIVTTTHFLQLTLEIPEKPLFRDEDGGLVIPQEPLVNVLKKLDGVTFSDAVTKNGVAQRKKYELLQLPNYLILHLARFRKTEYGNGRREKNPSIVAFPVKNLDFSNYVVTEDDEHHTKKKKTKIPTVEEVKQMSIKELKELLKRHGRSDLAEAALEKDELLQSVLDFVVHTLPDLLADKYDLVANITHENPADVGREGLTDALQEGSYRCHVQHRGTQQWYELQDLHVTEVMPQQIGVSESYVLIFERKSVQLMRKTQAK